MGICGEPSEQNRTHADRARRADRTKAAPQGRAGADLKVGATFRPLVGPPTLPHIVDRQKKRET